MSAPLLTLERVSKVYASGRASIEALQEISLEIDTGQYVVLVGKSGSGKSTLLQLIAGLDWPSKGRILFEGRDLTTLSRTELSILRGSEIGFVFQSFNLVSTLSALENVELPLLFSGIGHSQRRQRAMEMLSRVGLRQRSDQRPATLSGGEQQRVAIARALVIEPGIVLADEPTGNLDERAGDEILRMLADIHQSGKTVVLATHDRHAAAKAERVLELRDGKLVADSAVS